MLIHDCPRCGTKQITFDILAASNVGTKNGFPAYEAFCCCRSCNGSSIFLVTIRNDALYGIEHVLKHKSSLNNVLNDTELVKIFPGISAIPKDIPLEISIPFCEALICQAIQAHNAAGCMFRTTVDLVTKKMLEDLQGKNPPKNAKDNLAQRIKLLYDEGLLTHSLKELSTSIRLDGNDAAHEANLEKDDVEAMNDFTTLLLEEIYTNPKKIELAAKRRKERGANCLLIHESSDI